MYYWSKFPLSFSKQSMFSQRICLDFLDRSELSNCLIWSSYHWQKEKENKNKMKFIMFRKRRKVKLFWIIFFERFRSSSKRSCSSFMLGLDMELSLKVFIGFFVKDYFILVFILKFSLVVLNIYINLSSKFCFGLNFKNKNIIYTGFY